MSRDGQFSVSANSLKGAGAVVGVLATGYSVYSSFSDAQDAANAMVDVKKIQAQIADANNVLAQQEKAMGKDVPGVQGPPSGMEAALDDALMMQKLQDDPEQTMHDLQQQLFTLQGKANLNAKLKLEQEWQKVANS